MDNYIDNLFSKFKGNDGKLDCVALKKQSVIRIKALRESLGLLQEEFADTLNISYESYRKIENGVTNISYELLCSIASECKVSNDYIIYGNRKTVEDAITDFYIFLNDENKTRNKRVVEYSETFKAIIEKNNMKTKDKKITKE